MKIKHLTLFAFLFMGMEHCSYAQENSSDNLPMVELSANTKTYHLDRMGFEPNETLIYVINHLKEPAGVLLVNGEEYNQDMTTFLSHTLVGQVESIQFITDINAGTSTIGAYINVILKKSQDGTHGRVDFSIDTKGNHTPTASIYHKKGKWSFWANATGNIQDSKNESSNTRYYNSKLSSYQSSTEEIEQHTFSGNFGMEYRSDKDILKFRITEYHSPKDSRISNANIDYDTHNYYKRTNI